jgi:polysaccharide export outer membrane protein
MSARTQRRAACRRDPGPTWERYRRRVGVISLSALTFVSLADCASAPAGYVWASEYKDDPPAPTYLVTAGDLLNVQVYDNDKLSTKQRVREDGRISVPLLGDVAVVGLAPQHIARILETQFKDSNLVLNARVTVIVEETQAWVYVLGAVKTSGKYPLPPGSGVAEALAMAGGLTEFAHKDQIYVSRRAPKPAVIRFTFQSLTTGSDEAFRLQSGDVVKVQ